MSAKDFLSSLSNLFQKQDSGSKPQDSLKTKAKALSASLEDLRLKLEQKRQQKIAALSVTSESSGTNNKSSKLTIQDPEQMKRDLEISQSNLKDSVSKLHNELNTGLDTDKLAALQNITNDLNQIVSSDSMDARIKLAIVNKLFAETGVLAWQALNHLMKKKNKCWELPDSHAAGVSADSLEDELLEKEQAVKELFLSQNLKQASEVVSGVISAWKRYPEPDSWLWKEVCLRAVGTGIRLSLFADALEVIKNQAEQLRSQAEELMAENLSQVNQLLSAGLQSVEEAEQVVKNSEQIVSQIIPGIAWDMVDEKCHSSLQKFLN